MVDFARNTQHTAEDYLDFMRRINLPVQDLIDDYALFHAALASTEKPSQIMLNKIADMPDRLQFHIEYAQQLADKSPEVVQYQGVPNFIARLDEATAMLAQTLHRRAHSSALPDEVLPLTGEQVDMMKKHLDNIEAVKGTMLKGHPEDFNGERMSSVLTGYLQEIKKDMPESVVAKWVERGKTPPSRPGSSKAK